MGIKTFHKWIKENCKNIIIPLDRQIYVDNVYIDINVCLHEIIFDTTDTNILITKLCNYIDNILLTVTPKKKLVLASDGSGPYAKLLLQRERRKNMVLNDIEYDNNKVSSLSFTPGTLFMNSLYKNLEEYINRLKEHFKITIECMFNSTDEAELKILREIIKREDDKNEEHYIYSNDADVCVMSLISNKYKNIYVISKMKIMIDKQISKKMYKIKISEIMNNKYNKFNENKEIGLLFLLLGNDYIPKIYFMNINKLMIEYNNIKKYYKKNLVNKDNSINIKFLKKILLNIVIGNKRVINTFDYKKYDYKVYESYFEGLEWCFNCYNKGSYENYGYMHNYKNKIHPLDLYYYLSFDYNRRNNKNKIESIPNEIYGFLVLPKKGLPLIDNKYLKFHDQDKIKILYDEDDCEICTKYNNEIIEKQKTLKIMEIYDEDKVDDYKKKYDKLLKKKNKHKKIKHKMINYSEINNIVNYLKKMMY